MNSKEWLEGYAAYHSEGIWLFSNPYPRDTQQVVDWRDGYLAARSRDYEV
jgi:hypothetical protein